MNGSSIALQGMRLRLALSFRQLALGRSSVTACEINNLPERAAGYDLVVQAVVTLVREFGCEGGG